MGGGVKSMVSIVHIYVEIRSPSKSIGESITHGPSATIEADPGVAEPKKSKTGSVKEPNRYIASDFSSRAPIHNISKSGKRTTP